MKLKDLGEDELIKLLAKSFGETTATDNSSKRVLKAIGDDTSVTIQSEDHLLLTTTDILQEGVHFDLSYTDPFLLGRKSVNISTSDIASMGGTSLFLLMSIALPVDTDSSFIEELYKGIKSACFEQTSQKDHTLTLIGGNTSLSKDSITIGSTVLGEVETSKVVYRSGANIGDRIFVTGTLGDSALGLKLLQGGSKESNIATKRHLDPKARTEEGVILADNYIASSMIDLSDGLASDICHIATESNVGAEIYYNKIPLSDIVENYIKDNPKESELPLSGGEDYELLFTVPEDKLEKLETLRDSLPSPAVEIGIITEKDVTFLDQNGNPMTVKSKGFKHF